MGSLVTLAGSRGAPWGVWWCPKTVWVVRGMHPQPVG
jgi:hypothetical protein